MQQALEVLVFHGEQVSVAVVESRLVLASCGCVARPGPGHEAARRQWQMREREFPAPVVASGGRRRCLGGCSPAAHRTAGRCQRLQAPQLLRQVRGLCRS